MNRPPSPLTMLLSRHTRRREVLCLLSGGVAAWPLAVRAQQPTKIRRVGFLGNSTAALEANLVDPFRDALRGLGYVEGQNVLIDYRWADGSYEHFPALIADLIAREVDVIVTAGTPAALAVAKATTSIPCVMVAVGDPVGTGLIASLGHPGGNLTGLSSLAPQLEGKRLALLREIVPNLSHLAFLWNPANLLHVAAEKELKAAAEVLQIKVQVLAVRTSEDIDAALASMVRERPGALLVLTDRVFLHNRVRLMEFAAEHSLPGVYAYRELVEAGGLMSYGPNYADMHRRAAAYVDKILKGAKAADLPVEQPTAFELVINLKTAKTLGLSVPPHLLARADEVIE
jgi:putative tryptophan/tyrosine transport system substrate-binding protein